MRIRLLGAAVAVACAAAGCGSTGPVQVGQMAAPKAGAIRWSKGPDALAGVSVTFVRDAGLRGAAAPLLVLIGKDEVASLMPGEGVTVKVRPGLMRVVARLDVPGHEHGYNGVMPAREDVDVQVGPDVVIGVGLADAGWAAASVIKIERRQK